MAALHNRVSQKELKQRMLAGTEPRTTISFYRYVPVADPGAFRDELYVRLNDLAVFGRIYVAHEGINAQVSVPASRFDALRERLESIPGLEALRLNIAVDDDGKSFWVLKIKVRDKIVADGITDPTFDMQRKGRYLDAQQFNRLTDDPATIVVDMRNHYEYEVGHFDKAIEVPSDTFREQLPMSAELLKDRKENPIIMYCTGGIRCEKASAWLLHQGFRNVYHLEGGIIHYTNTVREQGLANKFRGKNFVFDDRMGERITDEIIATCHQCGRPADSHTNCRNEGCHLLFIQCEECAARYEGCCSAECQTVIHLPAKEQQVLRKGGKKGPHPFNKSRTRKGGSGLSMVGSGLRMAACGPRMVRRRQNRNKSVFCTFKDFARTMNKALQRISLFSGFIWNIGYRPSLGSYEKRKLGIFNFMNLLGLLAGILIPVVLVVSRPAHLPPLAWVAGCSPALISLTVLILNYAQRHEAATLLFFMLYPIATSLIYAMRIDAGIEFFFILYAVLSVFFLRNIYNIVVCFSLSMVAFLLVYTVWKDYDYRLANSNYYLYLFNHLLPMFFIFYGLLLIKNENTRYQEQSRDRNWQLRRSNLKILRQKEDISEKAVLLEEQTQQLTELNSLKNKLFSVIAHDLKAPLYALRNLFRNVQLYDLPGDEIKRLVPEVINELTYTTGLMENLLQWAKSQMQAEAVRPQLLDIAGIAKEVLQLLRLQADAKKIYIDSKIHQPIFVYADKDMVNLVLRNLLSNAIKFTPMEGCIFLDARELRSCIEISVEDTGTGISREGLQRLMEHNYYSTRGTGGEAGTGLGLMLCKEFLSRNGGEMSIRSEPGKGSIFSFTLPKGGEKV